MKIVHSPLQQLSFWMTRFDFKIIPSEQQSKAAELFSNYEVDIDFGIKEIDGVIFVYTKLSVNQGESPLVGYSFFAQGVTRFNLNNPELKSGINVPCFNIAIQNLRNHIASITSDCPLGKYTFPIINLGQQLKLKQNTKEVKTNTSVKVVRKRKTSK